jgi:hypothetical protein
MTKPDGFSLDGHGGASICFECSEVLAVWFDNDPMEPNPRMIVGMEDGGVAGGIGRAEFVKALRQMADWIEGYGREA